MESPDLLTVPETATRLRVSKWMIYNLIRSRRLRTVRIGSRRLVPATALHDFLRQLDEEAA